MVNIGVVEAFEDICTELLELFHREVEGLHEFVELYFVNVLADDGVVAGVADNVDSAEEGYGREHGVRAVEQGHLAFVVGCLRVGDEHLETGFFSGEFGAELFEAHV